MNKANLKFRTRKSIKANGFTLIELLAVIAILVVILLIAIPVILNLIRSNKKSSIESSAKLVAKEVENVLALNEADGGNEITEIDCLADPRYGLKDNYKYCRATMIYSGNQKPIINVTLLGAKSLECWVVANGSSTNAVGSEMKNCDIAPDNKLDNVRYIRNCIRASTINAGNQWVEIQGFVNGTNVALGKTASCPTAGNEFYNYGRITDGIIGANSYGRPDSGNNTNQCITVDLESIMNLDEIKIWHPYGDGRMYHDQVTMVSSDNTNWKIVATGPYVEVEAGQSITNTSSFGKIFEFPEVGATLKFALPAGYTFDVIAGNSMTVEFNVYIANDISTSTVTFFANKNASFYCSSGTCGISTNNETDKFGMIGPFPFTIGSTHHVALVFYSGLSNSGNTAIYIDGIKQNLTQIAGSPANKALTDFISIGGGVNSSGSASKNPMQGTIRNFRIWKVRRTDTEINENKDNIITSHTNLIWTSDY